MTSTDVVRQQVNEAALAGSTDQPTVFDLIKRQQHASSNSRSRDHMSGERFTRIALTLVRQTPPSSLECDADEPRRRADGLGPARIGAGRPARLVVDLVPVTTRTRREVERSSSATRASSSWPAGPASWRRSRRTRSARHDEFSFATYGLDDRSGAQAKPSRGSREAVRVLRGREVQGRRPRVRGVVPRTMSSSIGRRSRASGSGPWATDYDAMARKTCVRALAPWLAVVARA
jgi:recombination protein RecT